MTTSTLNQDAPFDPGIDEWCSSERVSCLTRDLAQNISLLKSADVLKNVLRAWVRLQVLKEYLSDDEIETAYSIINLQKRSSCFGLMTCGSIDSKLFTCLRKSN